MEVYVARLDGRLEQCVDRPADEFVRALGLQRRRQECQFVPRLAVQRDGEFVAEVGDYWSETSSERSSSVIPVVFARARKRVSTGNLNRGGRRRTTNPQPLQVVSSDRSCCEFTGDGLNGLLRDRCDSAAPPPAVDSQRLTCREYKPHPHGVLRKPPLPHRTSDHVRRPMVPSPKSRIPSRRIGRCAM